jgi:hypothetical protein
MYYSKAKVRHNTLSTLVLGHNNFSYHGMSRDSAARPYELLKLRIKDVVFKLTPDSNGKKQYAEILVNGKTGTRQIPLIDSIPYIKDWITNHHPQAGNPNSILIPSLQESILPQAPRRPKRTS